MIRIQSEGQKKIADNVLLHRPAPNVGLSQFYSIHALCSGHNRNELCRGGSSRRGLGCPVFAPPPPTFLLFLFFWRVPWNLMTQIANEGHTQGKNLSWLVRQGQGKTGRSHLTYHSPVPIVLKWDELSYLREGLQTLILVRSEQADRREALSL